MKTAFTSLGALAVLALLAGCEQRTWMRDEIADIAGDSAWQSVEGVEGAARQADVEELIRRTESLERENRALRSELLAVADQANRMASQVANNAEVYNQHLDDFAQHNHTGY